MRKLIGAKYRVTNRLEGREVTISHGKKVSLSRWEIEMTLCSGKIDGEVIDPSGTISQIYSVSQSIKKQSGRLLSLGPREWHANHNLKYT